MLIVWGTDEQPGNPPIAQSNAMLHNNRDTESLLARLSSEERKGGEVYIEYVRRRKRKTRPFSGPHAYLLPPLPAPADNTSMTRAKEIHRLRLELKEINDRLDNLVNQRAKSQVPLDDTQEQQIAELYSGIRQNLVDLLEITKEEIRRVKGHTGT